MKTRDEKDLKKYYKKVRLCLKCKKIYGSDGLDNGICPVCDTKYSKRWKKQREGFLDVMKGIMRTNRGNVYE